MLLTAQRPRRKPMRWSGAAATTPRWRTTAATRRSLMTRPRSRGRRPSQPPCGQRPRLAPAARRQQVCCSSVCPTIVREQWHHDVYLQAAYETCNHPVTEFELRAWHDLIVFEGCLISEQMPSPVSAMHWLRDSTNHRATHWYGLMTVAGSIEAALAELDMERYDDEEATNGGRIFGSGNPGMAFYRRAITHLHCGA